MSAENAVRVPPDALAALVALANAGRHGDLETRARALLIRHPNSGVLTKLLAAALWAQGKDALPYLERTADLLPDDAEALSNLGNALRAAGQFEKAVVSHRRAVAVQPDYAEAHNNLGSALLDLGRLDEAISCFSRAIAIKPNFAMAHSNLGNALMLHNQPDAAESSCRRALEIDPRQTAAIVQLAEIQAAYGRFDAAGETLKQAISAEPDMPEAWSALVRLRRMTVSDTAWLAQAQRIVARPLPPRREVHLRYALGKYFDDVADYEQAFANYRRANELAALGRPAHDRQRVSVSIDRLIGTYDQEWVDRVTVDANPSDLPVFIVGMPRSGTTLAEQILAAHGAVFGAGELPFWNAAAVRHVAARDGGSAAREADEPAREGGEHETAKCPLLAALADDYLTVLRGRSADALRVVDKMPSNFLYLGLLHAALPQARIIHIRRNPIDTCLSIYFQNFDATHSYANDLEDLAHYYGEYLRIMDHWRSVLPPEAMLEVAYEALVEDPETWSRRMVEFIGLPWDANCLEFHRGTRPVSTFSKWQARQKISATSIGRWRYYEKFLSALQTLVDRRERAATNVDCPEGHGRLPQRVDPRPERPLASNEIAELVNLANAARYGDMEAKARKLTVSHPNSGLAWKALSVALQMQGKEALDALERAARLMPNDAEAHSNLGAALRLLGRLDEAVASYRRALQMRPDLAEVWNNLGNAERDLGHLDAAVAALGESLRLKPGFAKAHNNLGNALLDLGRLDEAVASYGRALEYDACYAEAHNNFASVLRLQGRSAEAQSYCERALAIDPDYPAAITLLAHLRSDRGQFAEAGALLKRAIAIDPNNAEAWAGLVGLHRMSREHADWLVGAMRTAERALPRDEIPLRFAIGKYLDDVGDYDEAFRSYQRANELAKMQRPPHDRVLPTAGIDRLIQSQTTEWLRERSTSNSSGRPVLIVGMPRSGTTLAEQILASHPDVFGAGELPYWNRAAERYAVSAAEASDPTGLTDGADGDGDAETRDRASLRQIADEYLALLDERSPNALRVIDKMPANFMFLGLIHAALPEARIIHLERSPIDTCLSIYFQNFGAIHSYANDLEDLAHYYRQYRRIMSHWRRILPARAILEVPYEELVAEPEAWSRRMVEFIGLPWDRRCLDFYCSERIVSTFSKWQARQPINTASVERWRHYEKFVGPLRSLLGP